MKNYILFLFCLCFQFVNAQSSNHFYLSGEIYGVTSQKISLTTPDSNQGNQTDTSNIIGGKFQFLINIKDPSLCYINILGENKGLYIYLDPLKHQHIVIEKKNNEYSFNLENSQTHNESKKLDSIIQNYEKKNSEIYNSLKNSLQTNDSIKRTFYQKKIDSLVQKKNSDIAKLNTHFIQTSTSSFVSAYALYSLILSRRMSVNQSNELFHNFSREIKNSNIGELLNQAIRKKRVGTNATDFTRKSIDGTTIQLSNFKGHYIILDFWASWCAPCREITPILKEIENSFKPNNKKIIIISISLDKHIKDWKNAVGHDDIEGWINILDPEFTDPNSIAYNYSVGPAIPDLILIDPNQKVVWRYSDIQSLKQEILEIITTEAK